MNIRQLLERSDRPFASHPQVGRFYASASIEEARQRLGRTIERGDGLGVVIGSAGTGKSLLLQVLAAQYHGQFDVVLLACAQLCTRRALLQAILFELGQEYRLRDEGELRLSLLDQLLSHDRDSTGLLLLVDEAQLLPARLLEELRMLTNVVQGGVPRVRLVLAGMPALEEVLASPELESFSQRIVARSYLAPFTRDETIQYGRSQIAASGGDPDHLFATDAWHAAFEATDGVPRLVNQLCGRAMWQADAEKSTQIDRAIIQSAWSDLQQLPNPWEAEPSTPVQTSSHDVVEFGGLGDGPSAPSSASFNEPDGPMEDEDDTWEDLAAVSGQDVEPSESKPDSADSFSWPSNVEMKNATDDARQASDDSTQPTIASVPQQHNDRLEHVAEPRETFDPFGESFDEEEVVFDSFATWDSAHHGRSPRVENRRDRGFTALVQQAINASSDEADELKRSPALSTVSTVDAPGPPCGESSSLRSRVRLAVVSEPAPLKPIPVVTTTDIGKDRSTSIAEPALADRVLRDAARPTNASVAAVEPEILIVDDDPDETTNLEEFGNPDKFRRLLTRLRGAN
jgi:type II secretory pathway predicted ATPase ExeA